LARGGETAGSKGKRFFVRGNMKDVKAETWPISTVVSGKGLTRGKCVP